MEAISSTLIVAFVIMVPSRRLPPKIPKAKGLPPGSARAHKPYREGQAGSCVRSVSPVDLSGARPRRMDGSRIGARRYRKSDNTDAGHERHDNDPQVSCAVGAVNRGIHPSLLFKTGRQVSKLLSNQSCSALKFGPIP